MMEKGLISVDRWAEGSQAYFLTHLHADHTCGLSPRWRRGPLFCSPVTALLFPAKFPGFDLSLLRVLEVGATRALSLVSPSNACPVQVLVTAVDAHHCPGAVMYLFRGDFGCVLYTGDFRWESSSQRAQLAKKMLFDALQGQSVDFLYLDNTYCHPRFSFPPREVAAKQVADIIVQHPNHEIIIGIDTLGKEDLLLHISEALNTKIWVWPERLQTMHLLGYEDIFTTSTSLTRIRAVPRYSLTFETLDALNTIHPTIGIMPSGLPWAMEPFDTNTSFLGASFSKSFQCKRDTKSRMLQGYQICVKKRLHQYAFAVPYSEHSCFPEIEEFVKIVRPSNLSGIVSSSFCYINPRHYFNYLHRPSCLPLQTSQKREKTENGEHSQDTSFCKCKGSVSKVRKARNFKISRLSMRRSRVSILRRTNHGAKIVVTDETL